MEAESLPETALWFGAMIITVVLYFPGYGFSNDGCHTVSDCSPSIALHNPLTILGFFFALIGNVVPGGIYFGGVFHLVHNAARFEVVGVALFAAAVFILVQSWRHRASTERFPLPLLLIGFALLFDVTVSLGRGLMGPFGAANSNRYVMANLILLTGIVMYALAHIPHRLRAANAPWRRRCAWLALCALALFLVVQVTEATGFGLTNGRATNQSLTGGARLEVNGVRATNKSSVNGTWSFRPGGLVPLKDRGCS